MKKYFPFDTTEYSRGKLVTINGETGFWVGRCHGEPWLAPIDSTPRRLNDHYLSFDRARLMWLCREFNLPQNDLESDR